jgi:hypothetical protein
MPWPISADDNDLSYESLSEKPSQKDSDWLWQILKKYQATTKLV